MACLVERLIKNSLASLKQLRESASSSSSSTSQIQETLNLVEGELQKIQDLLPGAEQKSRSNEAFHVWLQELRCLAYDVDDIFDHFLIQTQFQEAEATDGPSRKRKRPRARSFDDDDNRVSGSCLSWNSSVAKDMCVELNLTVKRFDEISKDWYKVSLEQSNGRRLRSVMISPPPSSSFMDGCQVFGREDDKMRVISLLLSGRGCEGGNVSVVPIVGMGGIGKTAVAKMVYNDQAVQRYFARRGWVCVADDFDTIRLTKAVIGSISGRSYNGTDLCVLQDILRKEVAGRKVLLVLDDVWNEKLDRWELFRDPLCAAEICTVIVTTQNVQVADMIKTVPSYRLGYLPEDQCWLLFEQEAFTGRETKYRENLVRIGRQIVEKWKGLPLAIKALGGALSDKDDEHQWTNVLKSELWELGEIKTEIFPALELSYNRMPECLKPCLLYCSLFPKDKLFTKGEIISLWMAQGYLNGADSNMFEETGYDYFDKLQKRLFFERCKESSKCREMFKLPTIIHDLARSTLGKEIWTMHSEIDQEVLKNPNIMRHLLVTREMAINFGFIEKVKALRTLVAYNCTFTLLVLNFPSLLVYLRVLTLDIGPIQELPHFIGDLKHLRYLCVICPCLQRLPESICSLCKLQTLDICGSDKFEELPTNLDNLTNLHNLLIQGDLRKLPESTCRLSNLRTLALRSSKVEDLPSNLGNLRNLHCLYLDCIHVRTLPKSVSHLQNLQQLTLLSEKYGGLQDGIDSPNIKWLQDSVTQLRSLQRLDLPSQVCWPQGIGRINNLKHLSRFNVGKYNSNCARLIELKDLPDLGPNLSISGLRNLVSPEDSKEVNLRSKQQIKLLELLWTDGVCTHGNKESALDKWKNIQHLDEVVLENLQPHSNINELSIKGYCGAEFPDWLNSPSYCNLTNLELIDCENCVALPPLGQLPCLKGLKLSGLTNIKSVGFDYCSDVLDSQTVNKACFPFLMKLEIQKMSKWEEWHYDALNTNCFPVLRKLLISYCPKLKTLLDFPSLEILCIRRLDNLRFLTLHNSNMLQRLHIYDCSQLESVSGLSNSVEKLSAEGCPLHLTQIPPQTHLSL